MRCVEHGHSNTVSHPCPQCAAQDVERVINAFPVSPERRILRILAELKGADAAESDAAYEHAKEQLGLLMNPDRAMAA